MTPVHETDSRAEHDGLDPFESFAVGETQPEGTGEAVHDGLAVLIPVIAGAVGRLHLDVQRRGQIARIHKGIVLPRQFVSGYAQIADAVAAHPRDGIRPPSGRHDVPQSSSGSRLGAGKGGHPGRKIVRLGRQYRMEGALFHLHRTRLAEFGRDQGVAFVPPDGGGVIVEGNDGIVGHALGESILDHAKEGVRLLDAVNDHFASEEPVTAVFRVGLTHVEAFHVGRIAAEFLLEKVGVIIQIEIIEAQSSLLVDPLQRLPPLLHDGHRHHSLGRRPGIERRQRGQVFLLGHLIVKHALERRHSVVGEGTTAAAQGEEIPPGSFEAGDASESARGADGRGVGRKGRRERHAGAEFDLDEAGGGIIVIVGSDDVVKGALFQPQSLRLEGFGQEPFQPLCALLVQFSSVAAGDEGVEATFGTDGRHRLGIVLESQRMKTLADRGEEGMGRFRLAVVVHDPLLLLALLVRHGCG
mmetsp:Transcript_6583/g.19406  ORF Transcript_6583/g.19406 Transcript_6583/m.19406 type:complete len:470 (+) Transcript_6583:2368-3777(+)